MTPGTAARDLGVAAGGRRLAAVFAKQSLLNSSMVLDFPLDPEPVRDVEMFV
jgi:hypothetical protein